MRCCRAEEPSGRDRLKFSSLRIAEAEGVVDSPILTVRCVASGHVSCCLESVVALNPDDLIQFDS